MGNVLSASFQSYQDGELTRGEWHDSLNQNLTREHQKDIANLLGVDPDSVSQEGMRQLMAQVAEAYEIAVFITDDPDSREMLTQFAKDLVGAQSSIDWACFSGVGVFEIVLAALLAATTAGAGNIAHAASQLRHSARLRTLGEKFRKLAALLHGKKRNKTVTAPVDQRTSTSVDQPDIIDLKVRQAGDEGGQTSAVAAPVSRHQKESLLVERIGSDFKSNPLRQSYEEEVAALSRYSERLDPNASISEKRALALEANEARRNLGVKYKPRQKNSWAVSGTGSTPSA